MRGLDGRRGACSNGGMASLAPHLALALATALTSAACATTSPSTAGRAEGLAAAPRTDGLVVTSRGLLRVDDGGPIVGASLPVIFVHGNGGDRRVWTAQLAHLRSGRRAVAFDLPGFGESPAPADGDRSVKAMAGSIEALAQALGLWRFVLVCHSYGGAVASAYAGLHPERVAGLVFVDAMGDQRTATVAERAEEADQLSPAHYRETVEARFAFILKGARPATGVQVLAQLHATDPAAFRAAMLSTYEHDAAAALARYRGPRRAVAAAQFEPWGIQAQVPGIPLQVVTGVSHWVMLDAPEQVSFLLDQFLAGI